MRYRCVRCWAIGVALGCSALAAQQPGKPHPVRNPESALMLDLSTVNVNTAGKVGDSDLPRVYSQHAVISDVRNRGGSWVHQHAYLAHHDGRFWAMWSDGPGAPRPNVSPEQHRNIVPGHDQPGTRVSYATSTDGLNWSQPKDLSGPPRIEGFGWIVRGFWQRDGELLALASHFKAPGYPGKGLSLEAFRWEKNQDIWAAHGTVFDDTLNNFPPKRLPSGEWMMSRRDHRRQVTVMVGGVESFDRWRICPLASYVGNRQPEEPYWYVLPDGQNLVGLFRDNSGSKRLLAPSQLTTGKAGARLCKQTFRMRPANFLHSARRTDILRWHPIPTLAVAIPLHWRSATTVWSIPDCSIWLAVDTSTIRTSLSTMTTC